MIPPTINHVTNDDTIDNKLNLTLNKPQKRCEVASTHLVLGGITLVFYLKID